MKLELDTPAEKTWCRGCGDFGILAAVKRAIQELVDSGETRHEDIVIASGIGCHNKIVDYINVNSFDVLHGRVPPIISGMKIANPNLKVIGFAGDGDAYNEGISHLVYSAKRNIDITMIIHDNEVFALTTGQATATSSLGFSTKAMPKGNIEVPLNPIHLMLASGATFVARGFSFDIKHLTSLIKEAVKHHGFSLIDVLQPCKAYHDTTQFLRERVYYLNEKGHDTKDFRAAWERADEKERVPIGVFYKIERETFEDQLLGGKIPAHERGTPSINHVIEEHI